MRCERCDCGKEAEVFLKQGKVGVEVWFICKWCGEQWQDYCHTCSNLLELDPDGVCLVCGGM